MLYREAGQFKSSYAADQQLFPIRQDRIGIILLLAVAFLVIPLVAGEYWFSAILIPFLIFALAALGLNILTGYAGQLSLGSAAFMAVGAYAAYNFQLRVDGIPILLSFACAGLTAAGVGILFGLPSSVDQGVLSGGGDAGGAVLHRLVPDQIPLVLQSLLLRGDFRAEGGHSRSCLHLAAREIPAGVEHRRGLALAAKNMVRSSTGRAWMAVRDMDVAAEVIGIRLMPTKLLAFAVSSFYCGVAGALYAFCYLGSVEPDGFSLDCRSASCS
jgi:branched-chain amino acid transport system permease protein